MNNLKVSAYFKCFDGGTSPNELAKKLHDSMPDFMVNMDIVAIPPKTIDYTRYPAEIKCTGAFSDQSLHDWTHSVQVLNWYILNVQSFSLSYLEIDWTAGSRYRYRKVGTGPIEKLKGFLDN